MRIHAAPMLPPDRVIVVEDTVVVADGLIDHLIYEDDGTDPCIDIFLHPTAIEGFKKRFLPNKKWRSFQ